MLEWAGKSDSLQLAWYDAGVNGGKGFYTTPVNIQQEAQAKADTLGPGTIGRVYLQGTAAAAWGVFDPDALKAEVNGVANYGNPLQGCMDMIIAMGGRI